MNDTGFYSFEDIQRAGRVVPLSTVRTLLEATEPVEAHVLETDGSSKVTVQVPDQWNQDLKSLDDSTLTSCRLHYDGNSYLLTKRAMLTLISRIGLSDRYAFKAPGHLIEPQINYWFQNQGVGDEPTIKMLTKGNYVVAFMKTNAPVVSNLEVLEQIRKYLVGRRKVELFVDPNITNNFVETDFRIILPDPEFEVSTVRNGETVVDKWHFGVHVSNSLIASTAKPLTISGFMLEQKSLAGILPEYSQVSSYVKNTAMDVEDLRGWVASTLDQVFAILPTEAELIQHMPEHTLTGKVGAITTDLFRSMKVHRKVQELALENLTTSGDMTSYGIMHALAKSVAGATKFAPKVVSHIQRVSGTLPVRAEEICNECGRLHLMD